MRARLSARWWDLVLDLGARLIDLACRHQAVPFPADAKARIAAGIAGRLEGERQAVVLRRILAERGRWAPWRTNHRTGG